MQFPANSSHMCCMELALKALSCKGQTSKGYFCTTAMTVLLRPDKAKTAVDDCHCPRDMAVTYLHGWCSSVSLAFIVDILKLLV